MWDALYAWHQAEGPTAANGAPIFCAVTIIDATCSLLGESFAQAERVDPARGVELQKQAAEKLPERIAYYRDLIERSRAGAHVH